MQSAAKKAHKYSTLPELLQLYMHSLAKQLQRHDIWGKSKGASYTSGLSTEVSRRGMPEVRNLGSLLTCYHTAMICPLNIEDN